MSGSNEGNQRHIFTQVAIPPDTIGNWIQAFLQAMKKAEIPEGTAEIVQDSDDTLTISFKSATACEAFTEALGGKKKPVATIDIIDDNDDVLEISFNPAEHKIAYSMTVPPDKTPAGYSQPLIEVCQMCEYKSFRVLFEDGKLNVYIGKDEDDILFKLVNKELVSKKHDQGIQISTPRTGNEGTGLKLVR